MNRAEFPARSRRLSAGPYRSFHIFKERRNTLSSELCVASQLAALPTCKTIGGANPKSPIARGKQASNGAVGEMLIGWRLPWDVPDTIESKQAEFRTQPKVPVLRLGNCDDLADTSNVLRVFGPKRVTRKVLHGVMT